MWWPGVEPSILFMGSCELPGARKQQIPSGNDSKKSKSEGKSATVSLKMISFASFSILRKWA
jgi:hypothetical protein